ncbi:MAG TPA: cytochrome c maturation protein CcmE [Chitinophagaceae bacterium]|jgi:cytochrome c-type biogenesis protein CcmE|nr:cytochrome c maturation protein CcmE [Chitinophagaceae bacterium]
MKKVHIVLLVFIIGAIALLISFLGKDKGGVLGMSTYETIASAKQKQGEFVHVVAKLDHSQPVVYDPIKDPNYLSFTAVDSLGGNVKVIYKNSKPDNLEQSERLVMKGKMNGDHFDCDEIQMKCPSKYNDDKTRIQQNLNSTN